MLIFCLIPVLFTVALFSIIYSLLSLKGHLTRLRVAMMLTMLFQSLFITVTTELLSSGSLISFGWVMGTWLVAGILLMCYSFYRRMAVGALREAGNCIVKAFRLHWGSWVILFFLIISFFIAIIYPPNNYDSMTYHMARVGHWVQNHNVSYYPTHIIRQLEYQPFAEWVILHLQVLTGGDHLANAVQLYFFAGCISTVTLIAKELGASAKQQMWCAIFTCLIPMAVIQSN